MVVVMCQTVTHTLKLHNHTINIITCILNEDELFSADNTWDLSKDFSLSFLIFFSFFFQYLLVLSDEKCPYMPLFGLIFVFLTNEGSVAEP